MTDYARLIRGGVKLAKKMTSSLVVEVKHWKITGGTAYSPIFTASPTPEKALVEDITVRVPTNEGVTIVSKTKLTFFEPIVVKENEIYELPDGRRVTVESHVGMLDPLTKKPYMTEVITGE